MRQEFKNIVFSIEKFLQKCSPELKLTGLYVVDSISRAALKTGGDCKAYVGRFGEKIEGMFTQLSEVSPKDRDKIKKLLGHWKKSKLFEEETLKAIEAQHFPPKELVPAEFVPATPAPPPATSGPASTQASPHAFPAPPATVSNATQNLAALLSGFAAPQPPPPPQVQPPPAAFPTLTPISAASNPVLAHLLSMMGAPNQELTLQPVPQTPTVNADPNDFDYDEEDDGLNSKPVRPETFQMSPVVSNMTHSWPAPPTPLQREYPLMTGFGQPATGFGQPAMNGLSQPPLNLNIQASGLEQALMQMQGQPQTHLQGSPQGQSFLQGGYHDANAYSSPTRGVPPPGPDHSQDPCQPAYFDSSVPSDSIQILTRTIYVGGVKPELAQSQLVEIVEQLSGFKIDSIIVNYAKASAFVKMRTRQEAAQTKDVLKLFRFDDGSTFKIGWALGYGPKEFFDNQTGTMTIPISRLTDSDRRVITTTTHGGMPVIQPGHVMEEPRFINPREGNRGSQSRRSDGYPPSSNDPQRDNRDHRDHRDNRYANDARRDSYHRDDHRDDYRDSNDTNGYSKRGYQDPDRYYDDNKRQRHR